MSDGAKAQLRRQIRTALAALPLAQRREEERHLQTLLRDFVRQRPQTHTGYLLAYLPLPDEPDLLPVLQEWQSSGRLCLPQMTEDGALQIRNIRDLAQDLHPGPFGVLEPSARCPLIAPESLTLVVVPGRAFTRLGDRLGRGKGYYDRLLATLATLSADHSPALTVAPAFACQIVDALPVEAHDRPIQHLLSPLFCS